MGEQDKVTPTHILLGISSDTIVSLSVGDIDELAKKKKDYLDICEPTGVSLRIERISDRLIDTENGAVITDTSILTEIYKYLIEM